MKEFFKDLALRCIKTAAQTAVGVIGTTALITEVNWAVVASTVALSVIMCILMNLANIPVKEGE